MSSPVPSHRDSATDDTTDVEDSMEPAPTSRIVIGTPTSAGIHPPAPHQPHPRGGTGRPWGQFRDDTSTHLGIGAIHAPPPGRLAPPSADAVADDAPPAAEQSPGLDDVTPEAVAHNEPVESTPPLPPDEQRIATDLGDAVVYQAGYTEQQRQQRKVWRILVITGAVMAVVFVVSALALWGQLRSERRDDAPPPNPRTTCALPPKTLKLNIYNAAQRPGIAKKVAEEFTARKFGIEDIDNDPRDAVVKGVAEIRHGDYTYGSALKVAQYIPGATLVRDERKNAQVDVAIGTGFTRLVNPPAGSAPVPICSD